MYKGILIKENAIQIDKKLIKKYLREINKSAYRYTLQKNIYKYIKFLVNTIITKFKLFLAGLDFLNVIIYSNAFECCLLFLNQGRLDSSKPSGGG